MTDAEVAEKIYAEIASENEWAWEKIDERERDVWIRIVNVVRQSCRGEGLPGV